MTASATVTVLHPDRMPLLQCEKCGKEQKAACGCGVAYVPALARAKAAVKAKPEKSDRAIAAETGVHRNTVTKARKQLVHDVPVEKRTGRDGKKRKLPKPKTRKAKKKVLTTVAPGGVPSDIDEALAETEDMPSDAEFKDAFLMRCEQVAQLAFYKGPLRRGWPKKFAAAARKVAEAWTKFADQLDTTEVRHDYQE